MRLSLWQKLTLFGLGLFFVLGMLFRVFLANKLSYSYDELWAYHYANKEHTVWEHITKPYDDRPPVHYLLLQLQSSVSKSVVWLRFPSILISAAVLLLAAVTIRKTSHRFAIAFILLGLVNYSSVRYATQARDYGFIVLAAWMQIESIWIWIKPGQISAQNELGWKKILLWMIAAFLGVGLNYVYVPFLMSFIIGLLVVWIYHYHQKLLSLKELSRRLAIIIIATLPTIAMMAYYLFGYTQFDQIMATTGWIKAPSFREIINLLVIHFGLGTYLNFAGATYGVLVLVAGLYVAWAKNSNRSLMIFCLTTIAINMLGIIAYSFSGRSLFQLRYFAPLSVVSLLLISYVAWRLWEFVSKPLRVILIIWFFVGYTPFMISEMNNRMGFFGLLEKYGTEDTRLIQTIKENWRPGDQIIFSPKIYGKLYRGFYFNEAIYKDTDLIADQIEPVYSSACEKRKVINFQPGTRLIVAAVSELAYGQPESIVITDSGRVYPSVEVPLGALCDDEPTELLKISQTAIWSCSLKQEVKLTQYCFLE